MRRLAFLAALIAAVAVPGAAFGAGTIVRAHEGLIDKDYRAGTVAPTAAQKAAAKSLGATSVRWNRFGTVQSVFKRGGFLATGLSGNPVEVARTFVARNAVLFRLSSTDGLETLNAVRLGKTKSFVVTFRQRFGDLAAFHEGLITVGVARDKVVYVSSSSVGDRSAPAAPKLSAAEAWVRAAANVGRNVSIVELKDIQELNGWTQFTVTGLHQVQQARLGAMALPNGGVRPVWEANVVDVHQGHTDGYTVFVDAETGAALVRDNRVDHLEAPRNPVPTLPSVTVPAITVPTPPTVTAPSSNLTAPGVSVPQLGATSGLAAGTSENIVSTSALAGGPFTGSYTETACGPMHEFTVADAKSVVVTAAAPGNDIILHLYTASGEHVISDIPLGPNPEVIQYEPSVLVPGTYRVQVCPFDEHQIPPMTYAGTFTALGVTANPLAQPRWNMFTSNPPLSYATSDTRVLGCWLFSAGCALDLLDMAPHPMPWDVSPRTLQPTFTTRGNNAHSTEAWLAPPAPKVGTITPAEQYSPVSPSRDYSFPWKNTWYEAKCSPTALASEQRNDVDAAAANLFAMHNRMHDWSYFLGFTERTYNLQETNWGATAPSRENDPELGQVQSGGVTGGPPQFLGRDNANQLTLQDGVPGITNMYLWQPIAGGFYAPCVDGDYDMSVIGHEYTHAISNRMVAGPDSGLSDDQSRAMGESWSDLVAVEYLAEYGYVPEGLDNPFVVGAYATGNKTSGIRNYAMNQSPLNYSDVGYDFVCNTDLITDECTGITQVHADGEIWSATNFDVRQALIDKYNAAYPYGNRSLQERCANGEVRPADQCPGNRRWIQIVFDAFLLQQANTSMLDARDAYLAADVLRFGGANQAELWNAFAKRGMGEGAVSTSGDDFDPIPSFASPHSPEGAVTFEAVDETGAAVPATFFVGRYEARVTPIADTDPATELDAAAAFVPGTYEFVVRAKGYGLMRVAPRAITADGATISVTLKRNWASANKGATITGEGLNLRQLIDDTEATNWAVVGRQPSAAGASVVVDLAGGARTINSVRVSAMLRPRDFDDADSVGQNRFTALRMFEIWTCNSDLESDRNCTTADDFKRIYTSPADAFPTAKPRPVAPNLLFKSFDVPNTLATHVKLVVRTNQCLGNPLYHGDQDADPLNDTDCVTGSTRDNDVRAAELQVFS